MICYQDEKMYGPPVNGVTIEEMEKKIKELELKLYGESIMNNDEKSNKKPMIYDVKLGKLVERHRGIT